MRPIEITYLAAQLAQARQAERAARAKADHLEGRLAELCLANREAWFGRVQHVDVPEANMTIAVRKEQPKIKPVEGLTWQEVHKLWLNTKDVAYADAMRIKQDIALNRSIILRLPADLLHRHGIVVEDTNTYKVIVTHAAK
jgi:hypothetical protein